MYKFLIAFDGSHFSEGALSFVQRINDNSPVLVTGLFLPSVDYSDLLRFVYPGSMVAPFYLPVYENDTERIEENTKKFAAFCQKNHIEYRVHNDMTGPVVDNVKKESRFADLLIISSDLYYENLGKASQQAYMEDTTHFAECPVLIVPEKYSFPERIVLAFDGSESSLYAIKQFTYLFPGLTSLPATIVHATGREQGIPYLEYIKEFAGRHFTDLTFFQLETDPEKYFNTWITDIRNAMLVTGAYGRSGLSALLRKSFVSEVISEHKIPVFIAHK